MVFAIGSLKSNITKVITNVYTSVITRLQGWFSIPYSRELDTMKRTRILAAAVVCGGLLMGQALAQTTNGAKEQPMARAGMAGVSTPVALYRPAAQWPKDAEGKENFLSRDEKQSLS